MTFSCNYYFNFNLYKVYNPHYSSVREAWPLAKDFFFVQRYINFLYFNIPGSFWSGLRNTIIIEKSKKNILILLF